MQKTRHTKRMNILLFVQCSSILSHSVVVTDFSIFILPICIILPNKVFNNLCKYKLQWWKLYLSPSEVAE